MQQHARAKQAFPDAIVFFRLGDFYEMFGEDAVLVSQLLDLTLTSRNRGKPDEIPMAGVPHHAAHQYLARLLELGHKVAICEQMADPSKVKGIVPREVVRVLTPGLLTDTGHLDAKSNNWLASLDSSEAGLGVALFDLSTGELLATALADLSASLGELMRAAPREVLLGFDDDDARQSTRATLSSLMPRAALRDDEALSAQAAETALDALASVDTTLPAPALRAAARALRFAKACTPGHALHVKRIARWEPSAAMSLNVTAQRHLELTEAAGGGRDTSLLATLDSTVTSAGGRLLRRRLLAPLTDVTRIRRRLDAVELFVVHSRLRERAKAELSKVTDIERVARRAVLSEATPRDLGLLRDGLSAAGALIQLLLAECDPAMADTLGIAGEAPDVVSDVLATLAGALVERPPTQPKEGHVFQRGYDAALDRHAELAQKGAGAMVELEARLRAELDIPKLRVRYTRVFGWYVEVAKSQAAKVPEGFRRKQTVAAGERYTLPELDELSEAVQHAEDEQRERELELLAELVTQVAAAAERITRLSARIARLDVAVALAEVAHRFDYCRPDVDDGECIDIVEGRHPVVERLAALGRFVPNDVHLDVGGERFWLITGPNMAGKSTLLRQVALTAILAQLGSFVPAKSARVGVVDRVLSRVGASDDVARGESTFMVEMRETSEILRTATRRSLVILDEIGRGTSTFDGLAIAWAVAEHLDGAIGCRALFATHYHELTHFVEKSDHCANYSVSAREVGDDIVLLHRLVPGAASRSYGIAVAKLAGLPAGVLARAQALLSSLEAGGEPGGKAAFGGKTKDGGQLDLFRPAARESGSEREVLESLRAVDVQRMTPLDALNLLARLAQLLDDD
ncbi:MAG: DNA mismatch repair protein MutS [Polyangiaceae bacterium]